jgi:DNA-binding transcriptional MerR regulator
MEEGLNLYSIRDLENFSGIKAHTIRIWEKRYNILEPDRTDSNIRMYNELELKKILNVAYLNRNGLKISRIAQLDDDQLTGHVMNLSSRNDNRDIEFQPGKLLMAAIKFNEEQFIQALKPYISRFGVETAYINYLHPLLLKAGILWQTGSLSRAQEQFITNTIRNLIIMEDLRIKPENPDSNGTAAMINTTDNISDCNFLFYKYVLRRKGFSVVYTGGALPPSEVLEIHKVKPFRYLVVNSREFDFARRKTEYFNSIGSSLSIKKIIFTDYTGSIERRLPERIIISKDPADFIGKIALLK